ncbi:MAG: carbohydrate kinase family protein [Thermofilum sp.]|nr:carbohydrate kinase family protein [Thermofilum sp.]
MYDVVTVGHILLDLRFCVERFATPDRESPITSQSHSVGGSAANVAIGVRRLGGLSKVIGKVGFDDFGKSALEDLAREGVDISNVRIDALGGRTGFTVVIIDSQGQIAMYGFKGAAEELLPEEVTPQAVSNARFMHIASLRLDTSIHAARLAKERGITVTWDPGRVQAQLGLEKLKPIVSLADIIFPNELEAKAMTGEDSIDGAVDTLLSAGPRIVVVKRGARGVYVATQSQRFEVPAYLPGRVVDTTGAGDALVAGMIIGLKRYGLQDAARFATIVAGMKVTRLGSHEIPRLEEVEAEMLRIGWRPGVPPLEERWPSLGVD